MLLSRPLRSLASHLAVNRQVDKARHSLEAGRGNTDPDKGANHDIELFRLSQDRAMNRASNLAYDRAVVDETREGGEVLRR